MKKNMVSPKDMTTEDQLALANYYKTKDLIKKGYEYVGFIKRRSDRTIESYYKSLDNGSTILLESDFRIDDKRRVQKEAELIEKGILKVHMECVHQCFTMAEIREREDELDRCEKIVDDFWA